MYNIIIILFCVFLSGPAYAQQRNKPVTIDSRIKTLIYNPNEVFDITLHYGYQSHIDFAKGEEPVEISIGDSSSWKINKSGSSLFISPQEPEAHTNMTIITNKKRVYEFDLFSKKTTNTVDKDLAYVVRFYYPKEEEHSAVKLSTPTQMLYYNRDDMSLENTIMSKKNRHYSIKGDIEIAPINVFNDGKLTYMQFRDKITPAVSVPSSQRTKQQIKVLSYKDYVIVNTVAPKIILSHENYTLELYNEDQL